MKEKVIESAEFLKKEGFIEAEVAIILGTGLGELVSEVEIEKTISYKEIPHFPVSTVEFHKGKLIKGNLNGKKVIVMQGRFHYYEGYSLKEVVFPVRVFHELGIKHLLVSNAGGNMNMNWNKGELMLLDDHIDMLPDNPLRGSEATEFGPIFVDMGQPYNSHLNRLFEESAGELNIKLNKGVYVAVQGPNLETRAEYRYLRNIGADVVGMSTVPEAIAANQLNLPVAAISVLTDDCDPDNLEPVNIEDILKTAKMAEKNLVELFKKVIDKL